MYKQPKRSRGVVNGAELQHLGKQILVCRSKGTFQLWKPEIAIGGCKFASMARTQIAKEHKQGS